MKSRISLTLSVLLLITCCSGCRTYLGYRVVEEYHGQEKELKKTNLPHEINIDLVKSPSFNNPSLTIRVTAKSEQTWALSDISLEVKKEKYISYHPGAKFSEMIMGTPIISDGMALLLAPAYLVDKDFEINIWWGSTFDTLAKLCGAKGIHGNKVRSRGIGAYEETPPRYWQRLSQCGYMWFLNPFKCSLWYVPDKSIHYDDSLLNKKLCPLPDARSIAKQPLVNVEIQAITTKLPNNTLKAITDSSGATTFDLKSWQSKLTPHEDLIVQLTVQHAGIEKKEIVALRTDNLISKRDIALWDAAHKETVADKFDLAQVNHGDAERKANDLFKTNQLDQLALVIGINDYMNFPKLKNAVSDANTVADLLEFNYGFKSVTRLLNEEATEEGFMKAFKKIINSLKGGEDIFVYFAGHGTLDNTVKRGNWVPIDAKSEIDFITNSDIIDYVKAMDQKNARHIMVVADSCFSGSLIESTYRSTRGIRPAGQNPIDTEWLNRLRQKTARFFLGSGSADEAVPDAGGKGGHSIFADCLIEELKRPRYEIFTGNELAVRVRRLVSSESEQSPSLGVLKSTGHRGGEFVFYYQQHAE